MSSRSLTEGSISRALVRLSLPIIASNLLQTMYQITDAFWVGRISAQAVAAVSLTFPIIFLLISVGGGLPIAGTVLVAQYKGKGDEKAMNHVAAQTLLMVLIVSLVLSGGGYFFAEPIMYFMGAAPDVLPDAIKFLQITFIGFVFVFGYFVYESLMRGLGSVRTPMLIVLATVILNFFLDPLFIFGYGPVPAMGVSGAAMATVCTQAVATIVGFSLLFTGRHGFHLKLKDFKPDWAFMKRAILLGLPASIEQSTRALGFTVMTILVASFGTTIVAAYGIGTRVLSFIIIPAMGFAMATSTLVGQNIGAGKMERAERTNWIGCGISFVVLTVVGTLLFFIAEPFARFFVPQGGDVIGESATVIRILAFTFGSIGLQMVMVGTMRGAGDTKSAMILAIVSQWVIQFPLMYILSKHTPLADQGIWWSLAIANLITLVITVIWFMQGGWKKRRLLDTMKLQRKVEEEVLLDEGTAP